jgi:hypothetical protein
MKISRGVNLAIALCFSFAPVWAAIGDNAPPLPATYKTSHPRLPAPDSGFISALASNPTALARYNAAADAWDSKNPGNNMLLRRLVIAYMANKIANPTKAASYLSKIQALTYLGGAWGPLLYGVDDGVGNGTYTITSASANFLTACGTTCKGQILSIQARTYIITSVPDAHTLVLNTANAAPTGTGLKLRILSDLGMSNINIALIYDWLYNDLDAGTKAEFLNELDVLTTQWEENYVGLGASPYNDVFYIRLNVGGIIGALAMHPDHPNGLKHIKFMTDVWFNRLLPVWRQVFGPEGGGWHENWPDYVNASNGGGLTTFLVPSLLSWQSATGDGIFARESWLKNFAYFTMYLTRPDFVMESIGDSSRPYLTEEYNIQIGAGLGSLNGLAEIYNDPVLRGWARLINNESPSGPDGFEPSAWPFYTPDKNTNAVSTRTMLPTARNFTGWGLLAMRTGWGENDTTATLKYGDNFWSHEHFDTGSFTIFSRGYLALDSGSYRAGSASEHQNQYGRQTIAHNTLTITDPADTYPSTTFSSVDPAGRTIQLPLPNDGGQRRMGSGINERFPQFVSPDVIGDWLKRSEYYHTGTMVAYAPTPAYTYTAVDITAAYNNAFSASTPNATNRTNRVEKAVRHMLFIPRGTSAYAVIFDQVTSTKASFVKKWLLHSVNKPVISGSSFTITRAELVNELPYNWTQRWQSQLKNCPNSDCSVGNKYQYAGKLYGWMVQPTGATINAVGGPGKEFWIEDPLNPGTGTNWNQCMYGQCDANTEGLGAVDHYINPDPNTAPHEPGSWRIEEIPAAAATQDYFLNVLLATTVSDNSVPAAVSVPTSLAVGMVGATWVDGGKTYTVTFPQSGIGGHISITGQVDEDLLSRAQKLPSSVEVSSGSGQSGSAGSAVGSPLTVAVKDSSGNPVPNVFVHFGVTQGSAYLSSDRAITNAQGQASATLNLTAGATGVVTVYAAVNGLKPVEFTATVGSSSQIAPTVTAISCAAGTVAAGGSVSCTVTLSQAAPSGGATVSLSSNSAAITVPANVSIPIGNVTASFTAQATSVSTTQTATLTATLGGGVQTTILVQPTATAAVSLIGVSCAPTILATGATSTCTAVLSAPAPSAGAAVTLSSSSPSLSVPGAMTVPAGLLSATFPISAGTSSTTHSATITAVFNSASQTAVLTLLAPAAPPVSGGIAIPTGTWTMVRTHGIPVQLVGFEKLVYAPSPVKKILFRGNYHNLGTEPNQALNAYDFETNTWSVLDVGESFHSEHMPEGGHSVGGIAYNTTDKSLIYYCCASGSNQAENPFRHWWYDVIGQTGRSKITSPTPGKLGLESSTFDSLHNVYVLHGGGSFAGTWTYDPVGNVFTQQPAKGTPPDASVGLPAMAYNSSDHQIYLFGGQIGAGYSNDIFSYDVPTNTWTKRTSAGPMPAPRWMSALAYDSTNNVFLLYGGADDSKVYNDTWIFNPSTNAWSQLTSAGSPTMDSVGPFEDLAYDSDHNVFVLLLRGSGGYADGGGVISSAQTWMFRYQGSGPNVGTAQSNVTPTGGSINQNIDGWAKEPSLASSGGTIYAAWVETGRPFDATNAGWFHLYAKQRNITTGTWNALGGLPTSLDSEFNNNTESHSPAIGIVAGKPWISWYKWNNSGAPGSLWQLWAKSWDGSAWRGGLVGHVGSDPARAYQGRSQIIDIGGIPYIAFLEVDKSYFPQKVFVYVKQWNGSAWVLVGSGPLNRNTAAVSTAGSVSLATDGTYPYVAWSEWTTDALVQTSTPSQIYVSRWTGAAWVPVGAGLNVNASAAAEDASVAMLAGRPYVAWTERTTAGPNQLFVKMFNGTDWVMTSSGTLNKDVNTGWSFRPSLVGDSANNTLYVGWIEQQSMGQRAQAYVSRYADGVWTPLGSSLNADVARGSSQRINLTVSGSQLAAAWGEVNSGAMRQIFVKIWNGSAWSLSSGSATSTTGTPRTCDINRDGSVDVADVQAATNQALGVAPCTSADLQTAGTCNVTGVQRVIQAVLGGACVIGQ